MGERLVSHHSCILVVFIVFLLLCLVVPFNISVYGNEAEQLLNQVHSPTEVDADSERLIDVAGNVPRREYGNQKATTSQGFDDKERVRRKRYVGTIIGVISGLMTVFDFIWNKLSGLSGPSPVDQVLPKLQEMQLMLVGIDLKLEEIKNHLSISHMKTQLYESDRTIRDSLDFSIAAAATKSNESIAKFIKKAEGLESAISDFVDGMLDNRLIGSDILLSLRNANDNHARNFLTAAYAFQNFTAIANTVLAYYYNMKKTDQAHIDHWRAKMLQKEKLIDERIRQMEIECRKEGDAKKYVKRILSVFHNETTGQVAQRLYNELADRYDTSLWLVVVYATLHDTKNHALNNLTRRMHYVLDVGGKNAVAYAFSHSDVAANQNLCRSKVAAYENRVNSLKDQNSGVEGSNFVLCDDAKICDNDWLILSGWRAYRADYVVEVLMKHYDSELRIKDYDAVVVAIDAKRNVQNNRNLLEVRRSPSICYYSLAYSLPLPFKPFIHLLIVPGAEPPLLPGWDDFNLRQTDLLTAKKNYTRYGAYCKGPCSNEGGYQYFWCYCRTHMIHNSHRWDYCSPRKDVTIYNKPCDDACEKRGGTSYFWCHRKEDNGGWNYCSPQL